MINVVELSLHEIDIPDSYYQISSLLGNNHFIILCEKGTEDQVCRYICKLLYIRCDNTRW